MWKAARPREPVRSVPIRWSPGTRAREALRPQRISFVYGRTMRRKHLIRSRRHARRSRRRSSELVRNRWATAHHSLLGAWETIARINKSGVWRGEFIPPEKWRKSERPSDEK